MSSGEDEDASFAALIGPTKPAPKGPARASTPTKGRAVHVPKDTSGHDQGTRYRWPSPDERRLAAASGVSDALLRSLERGEIEPEERVDLHGVRSDSAVAVLAARLATARGRSLRCLVVIHGRGQRSGSGEAVLRTGLPDWLTSSRCAQHVLAFAPAPNRLGGAGATLVLLRR